MKIKAQMTDGKILELLGERLAGLRLEKNRTQSELAEEAGIGLRTLQRLESGEAATQLSGFVRVCRALGLVERFDALVPEPEPSPIAKMKLKGKTRKRASGLKFSGDEKGKWMWGEPS
ncbi:MAG: helix-turn-helix transcriptional regulator [Opitutales bacterium]